MQVRRHEDKEYQVFPRERAKAFGASPNPNPNPNPNPDPNPNPNPSPNPNQGVRREHRLACRAQAGG